MVQLQLWTEEFLPRPLVAIERCKFHQVPSPTRCIGGWTSLKTMALWLFLEVSTMILQVLAPQIQIEMPHVLFYEVRWWTLSLTFLCDLPDASFFLHFPQETKHELSPGKPNTKEKSSGEASRLEALCDVSVLFFPRKPSVRVWFASAKRTSSIPGTTWGHGELPRLRACEGKVPLFCWLHLALLVGLFEFSGWFLHWWKIASFWWKLQIKNSIWFFNPTFYLRTPGAYSRTATRSKKCASHGVVGNLLSGVHGSWNESVGILAVISIYLGGQNLVPLRRIRKTLIFPMSIGAWFCPSTAGCRFQVNCTSNCLGALDGVISRKHEVPNAQEWTNILHYGKLTYPWKIHHFDCSY